MSRVLLDTSAYSAYMVGHPDLRERVQQASEVCLNAVVIGEVLAAFKKETRTKENEKGLHDFLAAPRVRILSVDEETAVRYATIQDFLRRQGTPIPTNDVWIAATAAQHGLRLLTLDAHFLHIPQVIVDFFEPALPER
ncbi:MAG: type II toxin-antitoxin system VapC family toxin [candidate division NC10 bacterium]|nr:type II toxin-antitoxin system VapC family toxin [candidate division NC10 bacterium]